MHKILTMAFVVLGVIFLSGCGSDVKNEAEQNALPAQKAEQKTYSLEEVTKHNTQSDCWTVVNGKVADVTGFFGKHPGGDEALLKACGVDSSEMFASVKKHDPNGYAAVEKMSIGSLK